MKNTLFPEMSYQRFHQKGADLGVYAGGDVDPIVKKIEKGCRIMGLTRGAFSLIDLIHGILKKTGEAHVVVVTWSAGIKDANKVRWMLDSKLIRSFRLVTDHSYKTRQKKYALSLEKLFGEENIRTSEIHAKFVLIKNEEYSICIRSSMNLNANKTCESFELDEDKDIFEFYFKFVEHTFGEMPKGFEKSSAVANRALDKFFREEKTDYHNFREKQWRGFSDI